MKLLGISYVSSWKYIVKKGMEGVVFGIVTRLPAGWSKGLNLGKSKELFPATKRRDHVCGPHCLLFSGHCVSFPTVRRPKNDADHSPPSSAGIKNKWSCVYLPSWPGHAQIYPLRSPPTDTAEMAQTVYKPGWPTEESWFCSRQKQEILAGPTQSAIQWVNGALHKPTCFNALKPNDHYSGRTAPLISKRCILYIYSTNIGTEYFNLLDPELFFQFQHTLFIKCE